MSVDWQQAPTGTRQVPIEIVGANGTRVVVQAPIDNPESPKPDRVQGFVETNGYVSIEAEHYTRAVNAAGVKWQRLPDYGRTLSAMTAFPVTAPSQKPGGNSPRAAVAARERKRQSAGHAHRRAARASTSAAAATTQESPAGTGTAQLSS